MEPWQQVVTAIVGGLTTLGLGLKWFLTWLFTKLEANQNAYLKALEDERKKFAEVLKEKDDAIDAQREARLADKDQHAKTLLDLIEKFRSTLTELTTARTETSTPVKR